MAGSENEPRGRGRWIYTAAWIGGAASILLGLLGDMLLGLPFSLGLVQWAAIVGGSLLCLPRILPAPWGARLLTSLVVCGLTLFAVEASLQLFLKSRYTTIYEVDPVCLHRHIPGSSNHTRFHTAAGVETIEVRVNSDGYRGAELAERGAATRVVVFGDSFIEAVHTRLENTFVEALEGKLHSELGSEVEGVNAGVVGYGPDQISLRLERELRQLAPDLLVISLYANNDFGDLIRNRLFRLGENGELELNEVLPTAEVYREFERAGEGLILARLVSFSLERFRGRPGRMHDLAQLREQYHGHEAGRLEFEQYLEPGSHLWVSRLVCDHRDSDIACEPDAESSLYKRRLMEQVLRRIRGTAEEAGVPLVLLIVPSPVDVCENHELGQVDRERYPDYRRRALTDALEEIAVRLEIPHLNLFDPFRDHENPRELFLEGADDHWNDRGQALAAGLLARYVLEESLLGP